MPVTKENIFQPLLDKKYEEVYNGFKSMKKYEARTKV